MTCSNSTPPRYARPHWQRTANVIAIGAYLAFAALLLFLEQWAWRDMISPHAALVKCVPVEATVLGLGLDEVAAGQQAIVFPRVDYRYDVDGQSFESSVIRSPKFTITINGAGEAGNTE